MSKFGELISTQVPVLIDFYTDWNESSILMHPVNQGCCRGSGR